MAAGNPIDPIEQFKVRELVPIHFGSLNLSFTNSALFMVAVLAILTLLMVVFTSGRNLVPGRTQAAAEMAYEFIANTLRSTAGDAGMKFFPFVFSIFMFVLMCNLLGLLPYGFSVMAQIVVTFALSIVVISIVILYGAYTHGFGFLKLFVPQGVHAALLPLIVLIEVISFVARPITLSVRLFANMLAGHILLAIFGGFVVVLLGSSSIGLKALAILPFAMTTLMFAFELLVAVLQAYVFAILTSVYLNDAIHPGH